MSGEIHQLLVGSHNATPKFVRNLSFKLRSNFLSWLPPFYKIIPYELRLFLHFFHNSSHDHSSALYFLHESLKLIKIIRENNRHIHITCTPSFKLFNRAIRWISQLSYWRIHQVFLSVPPRLELFLHMLFLQHQILSSETLQLPYFSILVAFFSKHGLYCGICTTI